MHDPQMDIVGGLISGVGSGIVIAVALGLWQLGRRHLRRRQQIGEVRESVRRQFKSMINPYLLIHESPRTDALFLLVSKSDEVTTT